MDCRTFKKKHLAFVDDTLPGVELAEMYRHIDHCELCAKHDARVRRGLVLVRSIPSIEPSREFSTRLEARLREIRVSERHGDLRPAHGNRLFSSLSAGSFTAIAAGLVIVGYVGYAAVTAANMPHTMRELTLAPVIATQPELPQLPIANPALAASLSTGFPVWPAAMMAEEAPLSYVNSAVRTVNYTGR
jgi:hypothetical protein